MKHILIDTDVAVDLINGLIDGIRPFETDRISISAITHFELRTGIEKSTRKQTKEEAGKFLNACETLAFDFGAADAAGRIRADLESSGTKIGPYDTLIAGHALSLGASVLTGNSREFERVEGLDVILWNR